MARNPAPVGGNDEAAHVEPVATPATVAVKVSVQSPSVSVRQHGWVQWGLIAIEHEESARRARKAEEVNEHLPGLVTIAAAAFALDALYGVARRLIPVAEVDLAEERGEEGGGKRARHVADRLRRGVSPGKLSETWPARIRELFSLRDNAVHFEEQDAAPVWHPGLSSNAAPEAVAYRLEVAEAAVSLMLEVFTGWTDNPSHHVREWASQFAPIRCESCEGEWRQSGRR